MANAIAGTVTVVNTVSGAVEGQPITVGLRPRSMVLGAGGLLYVANTGEGTVAVIDTVSGAVIDTDAGLDGINAIPVGATRDLAVSPDGRWIYAAGGIDGTVVVIDAAAKAVVGTPIPAGTQPVGSRSARTDRWSKSSTSTPTAPAPSR